MSAKDPRVDAYIAKSAEFARPILTHIRRVVHAAYPQIEETLKWGAPHFVHKGIVCSMAAFKAHCAMGFWKGALVMGKAQDGTVDEAWGQFGRIASLSDLPSEKRLAGYVKKAVKLNEEGVKVARLKRAAKAELEVPVDLAAALKKNKRAKATFDKFTYSHRKEYIEWITEAKRDETRNKRLETTIEWLAEGKVRNWKYVNC